MDLWDWHDSLVRTLPEDIRDDFLPVPSLVTIGVMTPNEARSSIVTYEICAFGQEKPIREIRCNISEALR